MKLKNIIFTLCAGGIVAACAKKFTEQSEKSDNKHDFNEPVNDHPEYLGEDAGDQANEDAPQESPENTEAKDTEPSDTTNPETMVEGPKEETSSEKTVNDLTECMAQNEADIKLDIPFASKKEKRIVDTASEETTAEDLPPVQADGWEELRAIKAQYSARLHQKKATI